MNQAWYHVRRSEEDFMEAVVPVAISVLGKSKFSEVMKTEITL